MIGMDKLSLINLKCCYNENDIHEDAITEIDF